VTSIQCFNAIKI